MIQNINKEAVIFDASEHLGENEQSPVFIALPPGYNGQLILPAMLATPDRFRGIARLEDVEALESYLAHQVGADAGGLAIFVDTVDRKIVAVLDYGTGHQCPGHAEHLAILKIGFTKEFEVLNTMLSRHLTQDEFLNFLDEWSHLFVECAELKEAAENFHSVTITRVKMVKNQRNGTGKAVIDTDECADAEIKLPPEKITTVMSVFPEQPESTLELLLRYRAANGKLTFSLMLPGKEALIRREMLRLEERLRGFCETREEWEHKPLFTRGLRPETAAVKPATIIPVSGAKLPDHLAVGATALDLEIMRK